VLVAPLRDNAARAFFFTDLDGYVFEVIAAD